MWFGVLGHLAVRCSDGTPVDVPGPARRQLLAALLSRAGNLVTTATLIEDLWGAAPPRSAVNSLRSHVARLRAALDGGDGEHLLVTEGEGYRLCVDRDEIDAGRFETLVGEAGRTSDVQQAIARYDEALSLWRDEAYVEFGDAPFAVLERIRLAELRAGARERRTELALQVGIADELIGELEQRVRAEPYRERGWEQLALALYRAGRQADALGACRRARAVLADDLGVDPGPGLEAMEQRLLRHDPDLLSPTSRQLPVAPIVDRCPYFGLAGYEEQDAAFFVGRERLTSMLASRIADQSVVIVTGASGIGKSSLVRAGLVPALRSGALPGSASWRIDIYTPTAAAAIEERRRPDLLILDQAENLFTTLEPESRDGLVKALLDYVRYGQGRLVLVLRSDFYGRLVEIESVAPFAEKMALLVGPMRADELRRALVEPAAAAGLRLEDELIETVLDDVAGQPEPLPLLSEAMVRTWSYREGELLTLAGYRRAGEVGGALEAAAEECYTHLDEEARRAVRHVLVRMATPSGTGGWVRRPLLLGDAAPSGPEREALDALVGARLAIVADHRVELAHDALLEHWPRLRDWLEERALAADLVEHLDRAAASWHMFGRQDTDLYRSARLSAALDWRADHPEDVSPEVDAFIEASNRASQAELAAARAQADHEAHGRRRLRRVAIALAAVVALALAGGAVALVERGTARAQTRRAEQAALTADASRLAALATSLPVDKRDVALLLGAEGYELQPSDETAGGLQSALMQTPPGLDRVIRYRSTSQFPHLDHSGRLLAVAGADGVAVYDLARPQEVRTLRSPSPRQFAVFSGDSRFVAAGGSNGTVVVWDLRTGRQSGAPLRVGGGVVRPVFDPHDANRLYVLSAHSGLTTWDRSNPDRPRMVGVFDSPQSDGDANLTISPTGRRIAVGDLELGLPEAQPRVWDTRTGNQLRDITGSIGDFAADGHTLPFGFGSDTVLFDTTTGKIETRYTVHGTGGAALATLNQDGSRIAVAEEVGSAGVVSVYDTRTHHRIGQPLRLHANAAYPVGFLPDGRLVTTGPNEAAIWTLGKDLPPLGVRLDTSADRAIEAGFPSEAPFFLPKSRDVVVVGGLGLPILHDPVTGRAAGTLLGGAVGDPIAASPDGRLIAGDSSKGVGVWDVGKHELLAVLPGAASSWDQPSARHWSPAGNLIAANAGGAAVDVWDVSDPRHPSQPRQISLPGGGLVDDLQFMPDGRRLIVLSGGALVRLSMIDLTTGHSVWTRALGDVEVRQFTPSPDGATIAYDSGDINAGQVTLLDAATGKPKATIVVPSYGGVGYLNRGRWLVITSDQPEPAAQLYDAATGQPFGVTFPTADVDQHPVVVDPAGTRFAEIVAWDSFRPTSYDPLLWNADPTSWIQTACTIAGRNLTRAEWHQYLPDLPYRRTCRQWPGAA